jgi:hypothetical protein
VLNLVYFVKTCLFHFVEEVLIPGLSGGVFVSKLPSTNRKFRLVGLGSVLSNYIGLFGCSCELLLGFIKLLLVVLDLLLIPLNLKG